MESLQLVLMGYAFVALPLFLLILVGLVALGDFVSNRTSSWEAIVGTLDNIPAFTRGATGRQGVLYSLPIPWMAPSGAKITGLRGDPPQVYWEEWFEAA
jgi:hypothetical protein